MKEKPVRYHEVWGTLKDLGGMVVSREHATDLDDMERIAAKHGADAAVAEIQKLKAEP